MESACFSSEAQRKFFFAKNKSWRALDVEIIWCTPKFVFRKTEVSQEKRYVNYHTAVYGVCLRVKETEL